MGKYLVRGIIGGSLLGGLAWLAVLRGRGGQLSLLSGEFEGMTAALALIGFGLIIGLIVAGAAFVMMSILQRKLKD